MSDKYDMPGEEHIQQFHNAHHHLGNEEGSRTMWWEMPEQDKPEGFASGGSVISKLRNRGSKPDEMMQLHPAMRIPGVHIRTAEAGEPIFRGDD